jgi:hypothetical protein
MKRFRSLAIATVALSLSAGAAFAFTDLPEQALDGLGIASGHADRELPARPKTLPTPADADTRVATDSQVDLAAEDLPDAASHGSDVSAAAKADDPTPDTNRGADVSAVAKDNHGAAAVEEHKPADAGPPVDAGQPDDPGLPDAVDIPDAAPEDPGPPADPGKPAEPGRPN